MDDEGLFLRYQNHWANIDLPFLVFFYIACGYEFAGFLYQGLTCKCDAIKSINWSINRFNHLPFYIFFLAYFWISALLDIIVFVLPVTLLFNVFCLYFEVLRLSWENVLTGTVVLSCISVMFLTSSFVLIRLLFILLFLLRKWDLNVEYKNFSKLTEQHATDFYFIIAVPGLMRRFNWSLKCFSLCWALSFAFLDCVDVNERSLKFCLLLKSVFISLFEDPARLSLSFIFDLIYWMLVVFHL